MFLPNAPANPHVVPGWTETTDSSLSGSTHIYHPEMRYHGLTIRAHFAAMAMQGIICNAREPVTAESVAELAVKAADALVAELNK